MRKNSTAEKMLYTVRQAESGTPVAEVRRRTTVGTNVSHKISNY